jgi:hypothetical protein
MLREITENEAEFSGMAYRAGEKKKKALWPTPKAQNGKGANVHGEGGLDLQTAVQNYPTSASSMMTLQDMGQARYSGSGKRRPAYREACGDTQGQLSADWVEALMGCPQGWTDLGKDTGKKNHYPKKWHNGTWEDGIPRVAVKQPHRVQRLKYLGNAIVPQCAEVVFRLPVFDWCRLLGEQDEVR